VGDTRATVMKDWIVSQGNAELIIYGGDIYNEGKASEFDKFGAQMRNDVAVLRDACNHDWRTTKTSPVTGTVPFAYEAFCPHVPSRQPIDVTKKGGAGMSTPSISTDGGSCSSIPESARTSRADGRCESPGLVTAEAHESGPSQDHLRAP
jgi:hypothetical protein